MTKDQEASPEATPDLPPTISRFMVNGIRIKHEALAKKSGKRVYLDDEEGVILRKVIKDHPRADEKNGVGIRRFFVAEAKGLDSYCFHVERMDGSEEDFSYRKCFPNNFPPRKGYSHVRGPSHHC